MSLKFEVMPYHCQCKHKLCLSSKASSSSSSYSSSRLQSKAYPGVCLQSTPVRGLRTESESQSWITLGKSAANLYRRLYDCVMLVVLLLAVLLVVGTAIPIQNPLVSRKPESGRQTNKLSTQKLTI